MIPKRAGGAPSPLGMSPTLPSIPDTATPPVGGGSIQGDVNLPMSVGSPQQIETVVVAANSANAILDALRKFTSASPKTIVPPSTLEMLKQKNLICVAGNYAIVSEKGLNYLVDFNLLA